MEYYVAIFCNCNNIGRQKQWTNFFGRASHILPTPDAIGLGRRAARRGFPQEPSTLQLDLKLGILQRRVPWPFAVCSPPSFSMSSSSHSLPLPPGPLTKCAQPRPAHTNRHTRHFAGRDLDSFTCRRCWSVAVGLCWAGLAGLHKNVIILTFSPVARARCLNSDAETQGLSARIPFRQS